MKVDDLAKVLECEVVAVEDADIPDDTISEKNIYIGDLLSIVMSKAKTGCIWITIQTHINVIAVAELIEMSCVIVAENMDIDQGTIDKAKELNVPILKSKKSAFELASVISGL